MIEIDISTATNVVVERFPFRKISYDWKEHDQKRIERRKHSKYLNSNGISPIRYLVSDISSSTNPTHRLWFDCFATSNQTSAQRMECNEEVL